MINEINDKRIILSTNRALWGEVRPYMRSIQVKFFKEHQKIIIFFFYDSPPPQEDLDYDVEGTITAEMISDFPEIDEWEEKSFVIPYPEKIPTLGIRVFGKFEP